MFHVTHRTPMGILLERDVEADTIEEVIEQLSIPVNTFPTVCTLGDKPVLRKYWKTIDLDVQSESKHLTFITMPQGDTFKGILSLVATIALAVFAPYLAGFVAPLLGITGTLGLQLLQAGIVLAGSFLISTFLSPTASNSNNTKDNTQSSPTYSLSGQGNQARLFQTIPKLYGKHQLFPDYAAQPYSEYIGNQQYLNQLFCIGLGEYEVESIHIEDTEIWNSVEGDTNTYIGIEQELIPPGEPVTLFHAQVITSVEVSGQDLRMWSVLFRAQYTASNRRITSVDASEFQDQRFVFAQPGDKIGVGGNAGVNAGAYTIVNVATDYSWIEVAEPLVNDGPRTANVVTTDTQFNWVGPYVANSADTVTNKLQVDFVFPQGLFYTSDEGELQSEDAVVEIQARKINSAGLPVGDWFVLGNHTYTRRTNTPQRITETYTVEDGRYEVRAHRIDVEHPSTRYKSSVQWGGLKAFIPDDNVYPDVSLLAVRMLATGQLTQNSSRKINTIQTAKLPIWNPITKEWSEPQSTRSIAWAAADILRNNVYSTNYPDEYIDLEKLAELDVLWTNRGDTFNAVFDATHSVWDALTMVLRAGRTSPVPIAGKVTFIRDELRPLPRGVFTPANIKRASMEVQHILFDDESPDDIIVQFVDERTWKQNEVQCKLDGSQSSKPERLGIFGITDRLQAWREGMFLAAINSKRRVVATFTTEMEGRLLMRGDLISVAHDLYEWGQTGVIEGYIANTREMWLSEPVVWGDETSAYIRLRKRTGDSWGPVKIYPHVSGDLHKVTLDKNDLLITQVAQGSIVNTFNMEADSAITSYILCKQVVEYKDFIVVSGKSKEELVDITCIIEDPSVHEADAGTPPPEVYPYTGNQNPTRPTIAFFSASEDPFSNPQNPTVTFLWEASSLANSYILQISYNNADWETIYEGTNNQFVMQVLPGPLFARVAGINTQVGPYKTYTAVFGIATITPFPTQTITYTYSVNAGVLSVQWTPAIRATSYRLEIYSETVPGSGLFDEQELVQNVLGTAYQFTSSDIIDAGGPWPAIQIQVISINSEGESSPAIQNVAGVVLDPVTNLGLQSTYERNTFTVQWSSSNANSYVVVVRVNGTQRLSYNSLSNTQQITLADMQAQGGPWRMMEIGVTAKAGILESTENVLTVIAPSITPISGAGGSFNGTNVLLEWNQTADNGVAQTRVRRNDINDFLSADLVNTQTKNAGEITTYADLIPAGSGTWYYFITAYDPNLSQESTPVTLSITV